MQASEKQFQTVEELETYKLAGEFRKAMYGVSRRLPDFARFELASQIRRAAVSLTNNIAEGHGRYLYLDQIKFMLQARGSLEELQDNLNVCQDENHLTAPDVGTLKELGLNVLTLLNGYLRWLFDRKTGQTLSLHKEPTPYGNSEEDLENWIVSLPL